MKRIFTLCLALVLCLLPGCGQAALTSQDSDAASLSSGAFRQQDASYYFFETAEGSYYYNPLMENRKVYFSETGAHTFYLLCGKPDCNHSDENCNAFIDYAVGFYGDKLYSVVNVDDEFGGYFQLVCMNKDGTNHKQITRLEEPTYADGSSGGRFDWYFHGGYLFYTIVPVIAGEAASCYKVKLETGEITRLFEESLDKYTYLSRDCIFSGDCLYLAGSDERTEAVTMYQGNLETNEWKPLMDWDYYGYYRPSVFEDTMYYYKKGIGLCEYDLASGEETLKLETTFGIAQVTYDSGHIYVCATDSDWDCGVDPDDWEYAFYVYDRNYQLLDEMPLEKIGIARPIFQYVASDAIYFSAMNSGKITHYIDPQTIGTGKMELIPVTDPYSAR